MKTDVRSYIVDELLNGRAIANDEELLVSGLVDSIGVMRLVTHIEKAFAIVVPPQDVTIEHFANIDAINNYLAKRIPE